MCFTLSGKFLIHELLLHRRTWFRIPDRWTDRLRRKMRVEPSVTFPFTRESDCRQSTLQKKLFFWACLQQVQVVILMPFTHFLELRDAERLYVGTRDLADATRGKLVVIEASRVLYARIFVYRVLRVITQRCVRARSLSRSSRFRRILSIPECPWPLRTVEYSLCDGDRALVRRNRLKIDLWGSKDGFDWNFRSLAAHRIYTAAAPNRQIDLKHSFLGVWRSLRALCPCKRHFAHTETQN